MHWLAVMVRTTLTALGGVLVLIGCASAGSPIVEVAHAAEIVRAAEDVAMGTSPLASQYLTLARDELQRAQQLAERDEVVDARRWARRAHADADLAILAAREAHVRGALERTQSEIDQLEARFAESSGSRSPERASK
jgi:hypothetical protein